jgi:TPM domain
LLVLPVVMAALVATAAAPAATIRDRAGMFSSEAIEKAQAQLDRIERATHIPVVIETIDAIPGLDQGKVRGLDQAALKDLREKEINRLAERRDRDIHDEGLYILISKQDRVISNVLVRERYTRVLPLGKRDAIRNAFIAEFKKRNFDGGLLNAVQTIERSLEGVTAGNKRARAPAAVPPLPVRPAAPGNAGGGPSMLGTFLLIGLGILAVLVILRLLGGLFGRSTGAGYPGQMGGMPRPGMGPGGGPGYYGGPGYGGRGGGFFSGLLGGLGGALAGNWLYDQMSGRHGQTSAGAASPPDGASAPIPDQGDDAIVGADDHGGQGASWDDGGGDAGGGDAGGDWGGGDAGGDWGGGDAGGDWGGGDAGGDWGGGGGGDWGGGGGGGDWGGGGGGGDW